MASLKWLLVAACTAFSAVSVSAVNTDDVQIFSMPNVQDWQSSSAMVLQVSAPGSDILNVPFTVIPLTDVLGLNQSQQTRESVTIEGNLIVATDSNYANISGANDIAYLSCDSTNASFIDADRILKALMSNLPAAIVLYSQQGNCCGLNSTGSLPYPTILTMAYSSDTSQMLNITENGDGVVQAVISGNITASDPTSQETQSGNNSAIAMSILYSITGLITLLFLVIIATGAFRAHRYPERYGPRSGYGGRPRQSRAKGIARAVLETIPIVKFGSPNQPKPDPNIELDGVPDSHPSHLDAGVSNVQVHHLSTIPEDAEAQPKETRAPGAAASGVAPPTSAERDSSIGAASTPAFQAGSPADGDDNLGCSICTEDFTVGEDVRVLPCDHKFHPYCVDPWLVNVSGTCPLCRLDLHPNNGEAESSIGPDGQAHMPPPLGADEGGAAVAGPSGTASWRRPSRLFDLNRLRHASVEERIETLRRYRAENVSAGEDEHNHEKLTKRLRDKFRIRTRAQSPDAANRDRPS